MWIVKKHNRNAEEDSESPHGSPRLACAARLLLFADEARVALARIMPDAPVPDLRFPQILGGPKVLNLLRPLPTVKQSKLDRACLP